MPSGRLIETIEIVGDEGDSTVVVLDGEAEEAEGHAKLIVKAVNFHNALLSLARRVYAELGPKWTVTYFWCDGCNEHAETEAKIEHKPNCLWKAHEALLKETDGTNP